MIRMIAVRAVGAVFVILFVATFGFLALRAAPGGPMSRERRLPAAVERNVAHYYHLDEPLWKQYRRYLGRLLRLDLGPSQRQPISVNEIIARNFPRSLQLGLLALAFAVVLGVGLGVTAATCQNRWQDHAAMTLALVGISIPSFVLGPVLVQWFSIRLGWLPPARWEGLSTMILPALTLGLIFMGTIARLTRSGMLETIRQDYVRTARAKGLAERTVVWKHALRLGLLPVVTYLGPATAYLLTGSFVIEKIFQVPGLGSYFIDSVTNRDYPTLTGLMVFYCTFLILMNLLVDIAYGILDPRIREARR